MKYPLCRSVKEGCKYKVHGACLILGTGVDTEFCSFYKPAPQVHCNDRSCVFHEQGYCLNTDVKTEDIPKHCDHFLYKYP